MKNERLFELRRRTFDTPQFRGIEFIEVEAKSIINHVPGNYLPFSYTINPYRGCSHACSYCLGGDSPILMADGRTKPIRDVAVGDRIYGTVRRGSYRRYVTTEVVAHWSTTKPAYRIALEDGTELVASGDHRFLSDRGWKHVIGTEQGPLQRPFLTTNNKLIGTGKFARAPKDPRDYRRGYLCGIIRGDGHVGSYRDRRPRREGAELYRFRLALADFEALRRGRAYLDAADISTRSFVLSGAVGAHREIAAIRTQSRDHVSSIRNIIDWPERPSLDWCKGFLAGIFDAEGSFGQTVFRICNEDPEIIQRIIGCLRRLRFFYVLESHAASGVKTVRLIGGLQEHLRFFHTVDPAIARKRSIEGTALKSDARLKVVTIEALGIDLPMYDMTTGTGDFIANGVVSHNCFARATHTYMDMSAGRDFETKIVVKVNAPDLLPKELRAKRWKGESIAMGTATDPYQRAEGRYKLMPRIIQTLTTYRNPFSILTKGTLILRDLELLVAAAEVTEVTTAFSIGTLDEEAWRNSEPGTPHPRKRIEAVARLNDAGIPCGVLVAPILPGITDRPDQIREVVAAAIDAGATHVSPILLHLRPHVKEVYMAWLAERYPDLVARYDEMYRRSAYGPSADRVALRDKFREALEAAGGTRRGPRQRSALREMQAARLKARPADPEQLTLL